MGNSSSRGIIMLICIIFFVVAKYGDRLTGFTKKDTPTHNITELNKEKRNNHSSQSVEWAISSKNFLSAVERGDTKTQGAYYIMTIGFIITTFGLLLLAREGFKISVFWGIFIIVCSAFGALFFARCYWDKSKIPLLISLIGLCMLYGGIFSLQ